MYDLLDALDELRLVAEGRQRAIRADALESRQAKLIKARLGHF